MSAGVVVYGIRPQRSKTEKPAALPKLPQRGAVWPFPHTDPAERDRMAREHQAQQRAAIVGGGESPL